MEAHTSAFDALDAEIADLEEARAGCRRAATASRAAVAVGVLSLMLSIPFAALRAPTIALSSLAAAIGGVVWVGASKTSQQEIEARLADAEARKDALFEAVAARNGWRDITPTVH